MPPREVSLIPHPYDPDWTLLNGGVFNDGAGGGDGSSPPPPPPLPVVGTPSPNGAVGWENPNDAYGIPITFTASVGPGGSNPTQLLAANKHRNLLILQNLSTATAAGDVAPTLYFNFGRPAVVGQSQALAPGTNGGPGIGIVLDYICPRAALYVTFGPYSNAGASVTVAGAVTEGVHAPDENAAAPVLLGNQGVTIQRSLHVGGAG